jgi:hypothetical protein
MIVAPDWVCRLRYYCDQWLVWIAIGALALLAYKKDQQLDKTLRRLEGMVIQYQHQHDSIDKRIDNLVQYVLDKHER